MGAEETSFGLDAPDPQVLKARSIFEAYDLDDSGTCNSWEEAQQMTINILFSLGYTVNPNLAEELIKDLKEVEENPMDFEEYWEFFQEAFEGYNHDFPGQVLHAKANGQAGV